MLRVLNLYAGIGGNRKLWKEVKVTAIENNKIVAGAYKKFFPKDEVLITDAHQFLLEHYNEYDFIWSSPPCLSHSKIRWAGLPKGKYTPIYPDLALYQKVIFLQYHMAIPWVVENVRGYYKPLIRPQEIGRHYFWSNFYIPKIETPPDRIESSKIKYLEANKGFCLDFVKGLGKRKDQVLKNCVNSKLGNHIFECGIRQAQQRLKI